MTHCYPSLICWGRMLPLLPSPSTWPIASHHYSVGEGCSLCSPVPPHDPLLLITNLLGGAPSAPQSVHTTPIHTCFHLRIIWQFDIRFVYIVVLVNLQTGSHSWKQTNNGARWSWKQKTGRRNSLISGTSNQLATLVATVLQRNAHTTDLANSHNVHTACFCRSSTSDSQAANIHNISHMHQHCTYNWETGQDVHHWVPAAAQLHKAAH